MKLQHKIHWLFLIALFLLVFGAGALGLLPAAAAEPGVVTYGALADTYVVGGTNATKNYGTETQLRVKHIKEGGDTASHRIGYFKFAVPELETTDSVALRLYLKINQTSAPEDASLNCSLALADSGWDEHTVTYDTRPALSDTIAAFTVSGTAYGAYTIDVTETVQAAKSRGETEITFAYLGGSYITTAYSREVPAEDHEYRPSLVVSKGMQFLDATGAPLEGLTANSQVSCVLNQGIPGGRMILAAYENEMLIDVAMEDANAGTKLSVTTGSDVKGQRLCVFVWDEALAPLKSTVEFVNPFSASKSLLTALAEPGESALIQADSKGRLTYFPYTEQGDTLPDFSGVGYMGGSVAFPTSQVMQEVTPTGGDDTASIQAAIDAVAALPRDENGIRGVVLLKDGDYSVSGTLQIAASGVILRGESREGTVIHATGDSSQGTVVSVNGGEAITAEKSGRAIAAAYVPVGATALSLEHIDGLAVGDEILVVRPPSEQWIADIGMDANGIFAQSTNTDVAPWRAKDYEFRFERRIVAMDENTITIDHPIVMSMEEQYGGGEVRRVLTNPRISQVGVESLTFESDYDETVLDGTTCIDENHANRAVNFANAQHCWAKEITARYFINECVDIGSTAKYVTVTDCSATDFVSVITGERRYGFEINGQLCLVKNCYTENARHAFVQGARVCGPNVFYNCTSEKDHSTSEPHHRWAMGTLFDNVTVSQGLQAVQRGDYGSGQGWSGANMVFWNCAAPHIGVMKPPTAQNFAVGVSAIPAANTESTARRWIRSINKQAYTEFVYTGYPFAGDGYMELQNQPAKITSLYQAQQYHRSRVD